MMGALWTPLDWRRVEPRAARGGIPAWLIDETIARVEALGLRRYPKRILKADGTPWDPENDREWKIGKTIHVRLPKRSDLPSPREVIDAYRS